MFLILSTTPAVSQNFTSYFTGDTADVSPATTPGTVLMGGASENNNAMIWFLDRSGGGDIVVLRASGADGYNNYLYSQLGVSVNSVETIVFNNANASNDAYVETQIRNAEAIWIAGGDQWDYVSYWKGTPIQDALNDHINVKGAPIGGTSAGMAIQGDAYFSAQNGTVTSATAISDPMNPAITLGYNDFLENPWLENVITDTHYDNPPRMERHFTFLARLFQDEGIEAKGIGCDEYTAVCIDTNGHAHVYGDFPTYIDYAYFLVTNCEQPNGPETLTQSLPLTWNRNGSAVKNYLLPGTSTGDYYLDLNTWEVGYGGGWEDWHCISGTFFNDVGSAPDCVGLSIDENATSGIKLYPNPTSGRLRIDIDRMESNPISYSILSVDGQLLAKGITDGNLDVSRLANGTYILEIGSQKMRFVKLSH